tara:strand:+ start:25240 stop:25569 length:330 start_codon:yes stop_codon:yes gene_type:complete
MKKLLTLFAFLLVSFVYAQENNNIEYRSTISMEPSEVSSSALLNFEFSNAKTIKYIISRNDIDISTKEIIKNEGLQMIKTDFSFLENGTYEIRFFIDEVEVKKIAFRKI